MNDHADRLSGVIPLFSSVALAPDGPDGFGNVHVRWATEQFASPVPEPATAVGMAFGLVLLVAEAALRRRRQAMARRPASPHRARRWRRRGLASILAVIGCLACLPARAAADFYVGVAGGFSPGLAALFFDGDTRTLQRREFPIFIRAAHIGRSVAGGQQNETARARDRSDACGRNQLPGCWKCRRCRLP